MVRLGLARQKKKPPIPTQEIFELINTTKPSPILFHYTASKRYWGHIFNNVPKTDGGLYTKCISLYRVNHYITSHRCVSFLKQLPGAILPNVAGLTAFVEYVRKNREFVSELQDMVILGFAQKEELPSMHGQVVVPEIFIEGAKIERDFDYWDGFLVPGVFVLVFHD